MEGGSRSPTHDTPKLSGDAPSFRAEDDAFGFKRIATALAEAIQNRISAEGYVIGIEGPWGSGKTFLVNLVATELRCRPALCHKLIQFDPWLIGTKETLLRSFFAEMILKIQEIADDKTLRDKLATAPGLPDRIIGLLQRYNTGLELGDAFAIQVAAVDPTGYAWPFALLVRALRLWARLQAEPKSLEQLRSEIRSDLHVLDKLLGGLRFTVIVDDLDRLDPEESVEMLRLIKAVADFSLVTYLVCFDRKVLVNHVDQLLQTQPGDVDGHDYLEKIFQNIVSIPPQETFALKRFTQLILTQDFPEQMNFGAPTADPALRDRAETLLGKWIDKYVTTPRDAVRLRDAIRLSWPILEGRADFVDLVWLQLVKLKAPELYEWTRDYLALVGAYRDGARADEREAHDFATSLMQALEDSGWSLKNEYPGMHFFLPGLRDYILNKGRVFEFEHDELASFENASRLGSPTHWRLYFSYDMPSYAIADEILAELRHKASHDPAATADVLLQLAKRDHEVQSHFVTIAIERLGSARIPLSSAERAGLARAFANVLDRIPNPSSAHFGLPGPWRSALDLLDETVSPIFKEIVATGSSINWLADVMRHQGFAFGIPQKSRVVPAWLARTEFDQCREILLRRIHALGLWEIFKKPQPLDILYFWLQMGDANALRARFAEETQSTDGFLAALEAMRSWVSSSDKGVYRQLDEGRVSDFFSSSGTVMDRLYDLTQDQGSEFQAQAKLLLSVWEAKKV